MRFCLPFFLVSIVWQSAAIWMTCPALAQGPDDNGKDSAPASVSDSPPVTEHKLETYYLEREDGSLKAFFNIPYEEWEEFDKYYKRLQKPDQPPRFLLRTLRITGDVQGDFAYLNVTAQAVAQADGWVRIPLRMNQAMLVPDAEETVRGDDLVEYDEDSGLVWRVKGKMGQKHSLAVRICTKLRRLGPQTHLELSMPKASTSRLQLVVQESDIEADVKENAFQLKIASIPGDKTRVTVDGIGGPLDLVWQQRKTLPQSTTVYSATADVRLSFESQQRLRAYAIMRLNPTSGDIKSFIVQLPSSMRNLPEEQPGLDVKLLPSTDPRLKDAQADCEHVEVSLHHPTTDAIDLRLTAERAVPKSKAGQFIDVSGFRVFGAVSQTGTISLMADSQWAFQWEYDSAVEQVEEIPDTSLRQGISASFGYTSQPYLFQVKVSRKEQGVHAEPRYELTIEQDRVILKGVISCRLHGAETQAVTLDLSGWQLKDVTINDEEVFETPLPDTSQPIRVPLGKLDQSLIRDFDLSISGELSLPSSGTLIARLPSVEATTPVPAQVIVRHTENIEVVPLSEQIQGLVENLLVPGGESQGYDSVVYRGSGPDRLVYAAQVRLRPSEIVVTTDGKVTLDRASVSVGQQLTYRVLFQPVPRLLLSLPTAIVDDDEFRISLDDEETKATVVSTEEDRSILSVDLKDQNLGDFFVDLSFRLAVGKLPQSEGNRFAVPLAVPFFDGEGRIAETTLDVEDLDGRDLQTDDAWTTISPATIEGTPIVQLRAASPSAVQTLNLDVSGLPLLSQRDTDVEVAWLQTWLTDSQRTDRLAVRLTTRREQVRFRLPMSAKLEDVALDGQKVTQQVVNEAGDVVLKLLPNGASDSKIIEIWYSMPRKDEGPGHRVLDLPQLIEADWTRRFYWQLVLPHDEHLLAGANELSSETSWNWQLPAFGRSPRFDQRALELLVGTSEQLPLPESTNKYLFSSQNAVARVQITTAGRSQILLVAAVVVFAAGILLIYVPSLRHPASLLILCVGICVIGLLFPHPTIQFAQLSAFGLLFVLLAFAIKWLLARTRTGPAILHGTALSEIDSSTTQTVLAHVQGSSHPSTQALKPQVSDSASK